MGLYCSGGRSRYTEKERFLGFVDCSERARNTFWMRVKHTLHPSLHKVITERLGKCQSQFSSQTMEIVKSVDVVLNCDPEGAQCLLNKYATTLSINPKLACTEMNLEKLHISNISDFVKEALLTGFHPNFVKTFQVGTDITVGDHTLGKAKIVILHTPNSDVNLEQM